jgi:hypothetical protein
VDNNTGGEVQAEGALDTKLTHSAHVPILRAHSQHSVPRASRRPTVATLQGGCPLPHLPIVPPEQATKEVKEVYGEFYRRMSFPAPPNFIMTQGHSATVARGKP